MTDFDDWWLNTHGGNWKAYITEETYEVARESWQVAWDAAMEQAAVEFDRRDGGRGLGFYDPHEPAEIIRALARGDEAA